MAWCTLCNENREIDYRVRGDSRAVPTVSQRYSRGGEYIGYEEGEAYKTTVDSIPVCKWCGTRFEFTTAQSKEEYFYAKKQVVVDRWRATKPNSTSEEWDLIVGIFIGGFIVGLMATGLISKNWAAGVGIGFPVGIGAVFLWAHISDRKEKVRGKRTTPEMQAWQSRLDELQSMSYSEQNYQAIKKCKKN